MTQFITWCSFCNSSPAQGVLVLVDKTTGERMGHDACAQCVLDIKDGKYDWIESGLES